MANKELFNSTASTLTKNEAGGKAYKLSDENSLCQLVVTNCFNDVYYSSAQDLLTKVKELTDKVSSEVLAKAAVYGHQTAKMKDMPAYLLATLFARNENVLVAKIFDRVITNSKMLCNFVQFVRSGVTGRKSFGTFGKNLINNWLTSRTEGQLFNDAVGHANPSIADIIKMVHPKAITEAQNNMFKYILGKDFKLELLPERVFNYEMLKKNNNENSEIPDVDFRLLSNIKLTDSQWKTIAKNMRWDTLRRNLNTLGRHNIFEDKGLVKILAETLSDKNNIARAKVFPYELLTTYLNTQNLPTKLKNALHDALELSVTNIPDFNTDVAVCIDTSGSMNSPITGHRNGSTSVTTCVQLAGLIASAILRKNSGETTVVPFDTEVHDVKIDSRDSVMTNSQKLALHGGGTDLSCAMKYLNDRKNKSDLVIFLSDNESWASMSRAYRYHGTDLNSEWTKYKKSNPKAKLVLIDIQPYCTTQVSNGKDVLNLGGFSDTYFTAIDRFVNGENIDYAKIIKEVTL